MGKPVDSPLSLGAAKARFRLAAQAGGPQSLSLLPRRPLQAVTVAFVGGLLLGISPRLRSALAAAIPRLAQFAGGLRVAVAAQNAQMEQVMTALAARRRARR